MFNKRVQTQTLHRTKSVDRTQTRETGRNPVNPMRWVGAWGEFNAHSQAQARRVLKTPTSGSALEEAQQQPSPLA